jgi:hypothetical protein
MPQAKTLDASGAVKVAIRADTLPQARAVEPKISGAVIPRRVFTQPGSCVDGA